MDYISKNKVGKLIKISQSSSLHCYPGTFFYTTNRYSLPTTVSMYPFPIFLLSEHIMLATAAPQCSKVLFPSSSVYTINPPEQFLFVLFWEISLSHKLIPAPHYSLYIPISDLPPDLAYYIRHRRPAMLRFRFPYFFVDHGL